jgi:hypothetical protein
MPAHKPKFDQRTMRKMRAVLDQAGTSVNASQATRAKMAEKILRKAAEGEPASHEELKGAAIEVGKKPAP